MDKAHRTPPAIKLLLKLCVTLAVIGLIIMKLGFDTLAGALRAARIDLLIAACVVFLISGILGVVQWRILLRNRGIPIPFWRSATLYFSGLLLNNTTLGTLAGDAFKVTTIQMLDGKGTEGFAATFLDRLAGLLAMAGFAALGSVVLLHRGMVANGRLSTAVVALIVTFFLFSAVFAFLTSQRLQYRLLSFVDTKPLPFKKFLRSIVLKTVIEVHDRPLVIPIALLSTLIQALRIGVHLLCAASLSMLTMQNIHYFYIFIPMLAILMIVPLPFGVREAVGGSLFTMAGLGNGSYALTIVMQFLASFAGIVTSLPWFVVFMTRRFKPPEKQI